MPFDRKRRIFRPDGISLGHPTRAAMLAVRAGTLVFSGGAWFGMRPTEAPASVGPPTGAFRPAAGFQQHRCEIAPLYEIILRHKQPQRNEPHRTETGCAARAKD
jgi:hypothetical protein